MRKKEVIQGSVYTLPLFKSTIDTSIIPEIVYFGCVVKTKCSYLILSKISTNNASLIDLITGKVLFTKATKEYSKMSKEDFVEMLIESGARPILFNRNFNSILRLRSFMLIDPVFYLQGDVIRKSHLLCKKEDGNATFIDINNGNRWTDDTIPFDSEGRVTKTDILKIFRNELNDSFTLHYLTTI